MAASAYVGLGSNLGPRLRNLQRVVDLTADAMTVVAVSPVYETEPVGFVDQPLFLNAALAVSTQLEPRALLAALQGIEQALGKATPFENGPRTIDLDLLLYEERVIDEPGFLVPHPRMHERRFVLVPLADIAPDAVHPTLHVRVADLLADLPPAADVRPFPGRLAIPRGLTP